MSSMHGPETCGDLLQLALARCSSDWQAWPAGLAAGQPHTPPGQAGKFAPLKHTSSDIMRMFDQPRAQQGTFAMDLGAVPEAQSGFANFGAPAQNGFASFSTPVSPQVRGPWCCQAALHKVEVAVTMSGLH